jgi:hypothetical protein
MNLYKNAVSVAALATGAVLLSLTSPRTVHALGEQVICGLSTPGSAVVLGLYVNSGDLNKLQVPPGAETTFDSTTVHCPRGTCTLALSAMLEIHSADYQGEWGIVAMVDGQYVDSPYGPYQGFEPIASYATGNWQGNYPVSRGPHTVTFQIYPQISVLLDQWSDSVFIATP